MSIEPLLSLRRKRDGREHWGITSVCSAHPGVIRSTLDAGRRTGIPVLIESTCNQVNQDGGYTGMTPADFRRFVERIAEEVGYDRSQLILGGDHLGPNPWKHLPASEAMEKARVMIAAYAAAGFEKLHLDCSMGCAGEPEALDDELVATRAAELAHVAEASAALLPVYVIGTEVPVPGGTTEALDHLEVTSPTAARKTVDIHRNAFSRLSLEGAFDRIVALVVQPGVEFGSANVVPYAPERAAALSMTLEDLPGLVFEAHSTDYQSRAALSSLVRDGFAILKVGPGLTFALREALYALDLIASELDGTPPALRNAMEDLMLAEPGHWSRYYAGNPTEQRLQRHFSYSDRIRYYWAHPHAQSAVSTMMKRLDGRPIPETLISQYLNSSLQSVRSGATIPTVQGLLGDAVDRVLQDYAFACSTV